MEMLMVFHEHPGATNKFDAGEGGGGVRDPELADFTCHYYVIDYCVTVWFCACWCRLSLASVLHQS